MTAELHHAANGDARSDGPEGSGEISEQPRSQAARFKRSLAAGDVVVGHMIGEFWTRGITRIAAAAGFDFVIFDMEHSGAAMNDLADQLAWARGTSLVTIVRPPSGRYEYIARAFDAGVDGVMAPRIQTTAEARDVVECSMYPPAGKRGLALGVSHDDFRAGDPEATVANANENAIIAIQIETRSALERIDEITALPGVTMAWFGPHDYALECGLSGRSAGSAVEDAASVIAASCQRAGIAAAIQPSSFEEAKRYLILGYRCISFGRDSAVYLDACRSGVEKIRDWSPA